jgi:predicted RNA binding protein YcfA (HicA-like mRNA interferase family)
MKKIPRDINGQQLIIFLRKFSYEAVRQTGTHIRLTSDYMETEHHITIPNHNPIKIGTLSSILSDIALYVNLSKEELIEIIF